MLTEKTTKIIIWIGVLIFLFVPAFYLWQEPIFNINHPINKEYFGQFGDFITGVVGSLWALAGVILFYIALKDQRKDIEINRNALEKQVAALNLQVEEFKLQRDELKQSREIFKVQSATLKKQQFESTFFALLSVYNDIVKDIDTKQFKDHLFGEFIIKCMKDKSQTDHKKAIALYVEFYFENKEDLAHYFMSLYRVVRFVDESYLLEKEKHLYSKIVRSQLKENELFLLFYNAHTEYGKNFCSLILKYNLFKHLPFISKLEFQIFYRSEHKTYFNANQLFFCEWFHKLLKVFVQEMKEEKYKLLNEEIQKRAVSFEKLGSDFELITSNLNKIILRVYLPDDIRIFLTYLDIDLSSFINFQYILLYDILIFSQFKEENALQIETDQTEKQITFEMRSLNESGFDIITDLY